MFQIIKTGLLSSRKQEENVPYGSECGRSVTTPASRKFIHSPELAYSEVLASSPLQLFPDFSLCCVGCALARCLGLCFQWDVDVEGPRGVLFSAELQEQGHYSKRRAARREFWNRSEDFWINLFILVCSDSEISPAAASGFLFLYLQSRATAA